MHVPSNACAAVPIRNTLSTTRRVRAAVAKEVACAHCLAWNALDRDSPARAGMRWNSMATRDELVAAVAGPRRYPRVAAGGQRRHQT
jgi:hypothetical protein